MNIWFTKLNLDLLNKQISNTLAAHLGIEFTDWGDNYLTAKMPVAMCKQPLGYLHGGASCVLAETLASIAASCAVDQTKYHCMGLEINANHIRSVTSGVVIGITKLLHIGKSTQVWDVKITDENQKLICVSRVTIVNMHIKSK